MTPPAAAPLPARGSRRQYAANPAAQAPFFNPNAPAHAGAPESAGGYQGQPAPYQQPQQGYGQQQAGQVQGITNQFGQMGIAGQRPVQSLSTTNLVGLPLHPGELYAMNPPEILLPPNVGILCNCSHNQN